MSRKARIGIVGAGFWSVYFYLPYLRADPDVELVGVVRRNRDALAALRREYDLEVASPEVDDLLAAGCDGIVVAGPHRLHREHGTAALRAGCHVLVEKPMTVTLADALALEAEAARAGRGLTVAHGWNFQANTGWAADLIAAGTIGPPRWVTGVMSSSLVELFSGTEGYGRIEVGGHVFEAQPETWADASPGGGGGYTYGQLSHELGVALALVPADPTVVFARANFLPNGADIDVSVSVEFAGGIVGSFSGHGRAPFGIRYPLEVRVAGEDGVVTLDFEADTARCWVGGTSAQGADFAGDGEQAFRGVRPTHELSLDPGAGLYNCDAMARHFVETCLGRASVDRAPAALGRRAVAIMEAAMRSARAGEPVEVASLEAAAAGT